MIALSAYNLKRIKVAAVNKRFAFRRLFKSRKILLDDIWISGWMILLWVEQYSHPVGWYFPIKTHSVILFRTSDRQPFLFAANSDCNHKELKVSLLFMSVHFESDTTNCATFALYSLNGNPPLGCWVNIVYTLCYGNHVRGYQKSIPIGFSNIASQGIDCNVPLIVSLILCLYILILNIHFL